MGHWAEGLVDDLSRQLSGHPDREMLRKTLAQVGSEIDILMGRSFHPARTQTSTFEPNGLPFVDLPDLLVGATAPMDGIWPIPDPVQRNLALVLQVEPNNDPEPNPASAADALWIAGQLLGQVVQSGGLSRGHVLQWLGLTFDNAQRVEVMRRVMDPEVRFSVPVFGARHAGWWFQISRRLIWVTGETQDDGRLIEPLLDGIATDDDKIPLAAAEAVLIAVPLKTQPVDWAFTARVWPEGVERRVHPQWRRLAEAMHSSGVPTVTVDAESTPFEIACQVVLKGYWHRYIGGDEPALVNSVAIAYPREVERIRRQTRAPTSASAAVALLGALIRPGFNPGQGAEMTRRYVRRKASIVIMEHKKAEDPDLYPWTQLGISERRYYKLLPLFTEKIGGRYNVDQNDIIARMKDHLDQADKAREIRSAALDVLMSHGFAKEAARKWLQRHDPKDAVNAWPRRPRHQ